MATRKRDRIIALSIAMFFFLLASGLSIMVIVQAITAKHDQTSSTTPQQTKKTVAGTQIKNFTPTSEVKALKITDVKVGTGATAKAGDTVSVLYTGAVAGTGKIFQSTDDTGQPVPVTLKPGAGGVITGWADGVPGMKVGGVRRLLIPADQAYGKTGQPQGGIPPNSPLVFDVTLVKIGK